MADERIATIIKEINYWKEHKLLPDMYCDYLLALYTNGEGVAEEITVTQKRRVNVISIIQLVLQLLLIPFSFLVIYFTEFHPIMQLSILFIFVVTSFWQYKFFKKEQTIFWHHSFILFLLLLLITTVCISNYYLTNYWITSILIVLHLLAWLIWSHKKRMVYLKVTSIIGIIFTTLYIVL